VHAILFCKLSVRINGAIEQDSHRTRGGRYDFDFVDQEPAAVYELGRAGVLEKYLSPNRQFVRPEMIDKEGYWTAGYRLVVVTGVNTKLVRKEEAPSSYEDLLNPRWKGNWCWIPRTWIGSIPSYLSEESFVIFRPKVFYARRSHTSDGERCQSSNPDWRFFPSTWDSIEKRAHFAGRHSRLASGKKERENRLIY
jgi:Bacterial extracellular solute-binding protein